MARGSAAKLSPRQEAFKPPKLRAVETTPDYADPDDVAEFAQGLPEKYLHCREMNHNWRPFNVGSHADGGFERTLRCPRCRTRKVQHLSARGAIISSRYEYPEGYATKGMGRIVGEGRDMLRLESIKRIYKEED